MASLSGKTVNWEGIIVLDVKSRLGLIAWYKWCVVNREMMGRGVGLNARWKEANFCRNMYHILMRASKNKHCAQLH